MSKLSKLLRDARLDKGWSQLEVSERSGVPLPTVNRYENPKWTGEPRRVNVLKIARVLEIPDEKTLPAMGIPVRESKGNGERAKRWDAIASLAADDIRFERVASIWEQATDAEKDRMLSMLELAFDMPNRPIRRRRRADPGTQP